MNALLVILLLSVSPVVLGQSEKPQHTERPSIGEAVATLDLADSALQRYEDLLADRKAGAKLSLPAFDPEGDYRNDLTAVRDGRKLIAALKARPEQISTPLLIAILTEVNDSIENVLSRSARLEHFTCSASAHSEAGALGKSLAETRDQLDQASTAMVALALHWSQFDLEQLTDAQPHRGVRAERTF